jgi:hypothetical protein
MKSAPSEFDEGTHGYPQGIATATGINNDTKEQQLKLFLQNAGPSQPTFGIQSTTHLGSKSIINTESRALLQVSESMINHVINDNLNKTISPSYLNSSNPRLFPVIYNDKSRATFGARSKSVIPNQTI